MALEMTVTTSGITVANAIHRVECVTLHGKTQMAFLVRSYANQSAEVPFLEHTFECAYTLTGDNPLTQAYEYLKSLPEFSEAVDA